MESYEPTKRETPLHERSPDEWLNRMNTLPADIQPVIARLVWWDYYGSQTHANAWKNLDGKRNLPMGNIPECDQIKALIKLGYTAHKASKRVGCNYD
jgi:hypothetical protein